jgi:hypothetical protein
VTLLLLLIGPAAVAPVLAAVLYQDSPAGTAHTTQKGIGNQTSHDQAPLADVAAELSQGTTVL